ncbi:uncharacterized protein LOC135936127 [Cloeon dipterum]|uniref:uncharacterized protein LOC135936127 n=1 Tax=Cloeon dipterum TaxID=197152 RepID=UPI003220808A
MDISGLFVKSQRGPNLIFYVLFIGITLVLLNLKILFLRHYLRTPKLNLDDTNISTSDVVQRAERSNPNVPFVLWNRMDPRDFRVNTSCALYVTPLEISFNNLYWQVQQTVDANLYFFGAYYDIRPLDGPVVRILATVDSRQAEKKSLFCQIWFVETTPSFSQVSFHYLGNENWVGKDVRMQPYMLTCKLPANGEIPKSVSIVADRCDNATNNLKVIYNQLPREEKKKAFAVCAKTLFFENRDESFPTRLVQWMEMLRILGASNISFYTFQVGEDVKRVLNYYQDTGFAIIFPITMPGSIVNVPELLEIYLRKHQREREAQQLIHYNDCLYRNMYLFDYIVPLDVEELIVPVSTNSWHELFALKTISDASNKSSAFLTHNKNVLYLLEEKNASNESLRDFPRLRNEERNAMAEFKSFQNTKKVVLMREQEPKECFGACEMYVFRPEEARLQRYKRSLSSKANNVKTDKTLGKFKHELIENTNKVLKNVGFSP